MNPYDMIYDLNDEVNKLTQQLEVTKASLSKWESVFGHLGTPDEVGNEWVAMSVRLEAAETAWKESDKSCHDLIEKVIPNLRGWLEEAERSLDCCRSERKEAAELFLSVKTKLLAEHHALQDKVGQVMKRLQLIIEEPEKTVSNSHAIREMLRQATLALKEVK